MELDPRSLKPAERYKLLIGSVVPRPIAFVSTISVQGRHNLAPFSFFNGIAGTPMTLLFCPSNKDDGTEKDTLRNCKPVAEGGTGEFVVNAASELYTKELTASAEPLAWGESEFDLVGLTPEPGRVVKAPRVREAPWSFECRTLQVVRMSPGAPGGGNVVIGEVVHITVSDAIVDARFHVDQRKLRAFGRMGGDLYARTTDVFEMPRGRAALQATPRDLPR
ncbi:MAG TPA: flavin reductase family protein [Planctomycetota bacterium]|nr:flavin reductase family protein [Planctomycetota bacterium]